MEVFIMDYEEKGQSTSAVGAIITLVVGIGVAVLVQIFVGALGGQTYNLVEDDIDNISDTVIRGHVDSAITSSFEALETTGDYMPVIVLAVVISIVLALVLGFGAVGGSGGRGMAL
jgi:hypothetical protein